jgi:hypothetical protein
MVHFREARVKALGRSTHETTSLGQQSQHLSTPHKSHDHSIENEDEKGKSCRDKSLVDILAYPCRHVPLLSLN